MRTSACCPSRALLAVSVLPFLFAIRTTAVFVNPGFYKVTELGVPAGFTASRAVGINNQGQVLGAATNANGPERYFLWQDGRLRGLGDAQGHGRAFHGMNDVGQIVGDAPGPSGGRIGFVWSKGSVQDLRPPPGYDDMSPDAINNHGQIVGRAYTRAPGGGNTKIARAFLCDHGQIRLLDTLGYTESYVSDINDRGEIVGWLSSVGKEQCFLHQGNTIRALGAGAAMAINNRGVILGSFRSEEGRAHVGLWQNDRLSELPTLPGYTAARALDLNDRNEVVGYSRKIQVGVYSGDPEVDRACLWRDGRVYDLQDLLPVNSGWNYVTAKAINNRGQIVGSGSLHGRSRALLLTPVAGVKQARRP
jgi:probable HAF family extracellular repeat protein